MDQQEFADTMLEYPISMSEVLGCLDVPRIPNVLHDEAYALREDMRERAVQAAVSALQNETGDRLLPTADMAKIIAQVLQSLRSVIVLEFDSLRTEVHGAIVNAAILSFVERYQYVAVDWLLPSHPDLAWEQEAMDEFELVDLLERKFGDIFLERIKRILEEGA